MLFLDELPEFGSYLLETLRQPLEDGLISISRASGSMQFPAKMMVVAAMNPCPCGFAGDPGRSCTCAEGAITRYSRRVSGPILDRIDLHIEVPRVEYDKLSGAGAAESSRAVRSRVSRAREIQTKRYSGSGIVTNSEMGPAEISEFCVLDESGERILRAATAQLALSARGYHRVLKLARTIADLADCVQIEVSHLAEALHYRARGQVAIAEA